ncbi:MAG TPA: SpoIIE family protein phosphatase [Lacunisphaera sp.]|nr:SpoIIE family protein phosphatase [Lacunisphaera sp.]
METSSPLQRVDWAVAQRTLPGQIVSGDRHVVLTHARGVTLAVIDGIGHGPEAAKAADLAVEALRLLPENNPLAQITRCHLALGRSRGVVMTLAEFNLRDETLTLCGVGNVDATLFRSVTGPGTPARESALLRGGVVGDQLPAPHASIIPVCAGDLLVMASDGIRLEYPRDLAGRIDLQHLADQLLDRNFKGTDDALVLLARLKEAADE